MTSSAPLRQGQIRRVPFAYEDRPDVVKVRPAIVWQIDDDSALIVLIKVTGHGPRREWPGEVPLADWADEGLSKPSCARCAKVMAVPAADVEAMELLGQLTSADIAAVAQGVLDAGGYWQF